MQHNMTSETCRFCASTGLETFIDLGETPLANSYVSPEDAASQDACYPLHARVCSNCFLVQVADAVPPDKIFSHYAYFSSFSTSWVSHAKNYATMAARRLNLSPDSLVVEVASNDGYLLQHFVAMDIPVLGVEPAANIALEAEQKGVRTEVAFFGHQTARDLRSQYGAADLTAANNVLAHVPDINDFVAGFAEILKPQGVATFEFPHLLSLMAETQFDTIYHEHFSYLSLYAVEQCFERHGMRVFDVEGLPTHGGSLRVWACLAGADYEVCDGLEKVRHQEATAGINRLESYQGFAPRVAKIRDDLLGFLHGAHDHGKTVAAYGAAAKGNTLLNFSRVTPDLITCVADANPHKQGTLLPGSRIAVISPQELDNQKPDYILILPWNLRQEISSSMDHVRQWGGQFVVAIPELEIF